MDSRPVVHLFSALTPSTQRLGPSAEALRALAARGRGQRIARTTRQLLALGHRRIMLVSGPERDALLTNADLYGHCQVMLAEGLPLLPRLELEAAIEPAWPELATLLDEVAPTALLCSRDVLVPGLETAVRRHAGLARLVIVGPGSGTPGLGTSRH